MSDSEAHAAESDHGEIPVHPRIPAGEPELIDTQSGFINLIERLREAGEFAYDTEFIGEHTYYPQVCLIQVATMGFVALIDPLAGFDVGPLWELLADPDVTKLVHAGLQDLEPVHRLTGKHPAAVFDTQIAAALVGSRYPVSLAELASVYCGAEMGRGLKFSQWDRRPLTPKQRRYAADDVRYLPLLVERLRARLDEMGRTSWADAEFEHFADLSIYRTDPATRKLKAKGVSKMKLRPKAALRALVVWREGVARERDISPRELINDELLFEIATERVVEADQLKRIAGVPKVVRRELAQDIAAVVRDVFEGPRPPAPLRRPRPTEREEEAMAHAWAGLGERCEALAVAQSLVMSRKSISDIALRAVRTGAATSVEGWRAELVDPVILSVLRRFGSRPPAQDDA